MVLRRVLVELAAVDAVVMVLDSAKGIEPQTLKLFEVCRDRGLPIVTFVNRNATTPAARGAAAANIAPRSAAKR